MTTKKITIRLPKASWNQIVDDIENMCGAPALDIEILRDIEVLDEDTITMGEFMARVMAAPRRKT
jgi:hypothetical protein